MAVEIGLKWYLVFPDIFNLEQPDAIRYGNMSNVPGFCWPRFDEGAFHSIITDQLGTFVCLRLLNQNRPIIDDEFASDGHRIKSERMLAGQVRALCVCRLFGSWNNL